MDFLKIIVPIGDGVNVEDIPEDVFEAARKSVQMWNEYYEKEALIRMQELEQENARLKMELVRLTRPSGFNARL